MRRSFLVLALLALLAPLALEAQIDTRGKASVQLAGFGSVADGTTLVTLVAGLTYFASTALELGADISTNYMSTDTSDDTSGFVTARARYNFVRQSLFVPYISAGVGTQLGVDDFDVLTYSGGVGFKRFLNERVSFNGEANYTTIQFESDSFGSSDSSAIMFLFGISIYTGN